MGGYVALAFQRRHPARTAGLILAATRAGADSDEGKANRDRGIATAEAQGAGPIVDAMLPKMLAAQTYTTQPEVVAETRAIMESATVPGIVGALAALRDRPDATTQLGEITVPVLVLHGAPSAATARRMARVGEAVVQAGGDLAGLEIARIA
jgi:pimeloyl-ACP methyl ester carboxylesterase